MTFEEIRDRLDRREYGSNEGQELVRSALLVLMDGAINEGHSPDLTATCFVCQALGEILAIADLLESRRPA